MSEAMETMKHNLSGAHKSIVTLAYRHDEARFMEPFGTAGPTCTSLHFGMDGVNDCDYPYAEKCMITSMCGGIAGIAKKDFANLKETGRFNAGRGFSKWGEGWRGFIMNTIRVASATQEGPAASPLLKVLLLSNHKDYGFKQLAFYYVSSSDTPFHFSKGGECEMTAEHKILYTQHMHKYHSESNPFGHVCIYPQTKKSKEIYQSIEKFLFSVFNERIRGEGLQLNIGGKLIEATYPLCGPWVHENRTPDNFFNNYIGLVKFGKCSYKDPKVRAKTYPTIMYYDKLLPKSVIEKHPLAKHGYLFPAKSKKAGQLVFANPDYIIDYTWDDDMTHKQSISNATQKINEMQVKKFFHTGSGAATTALNGYHIFMKSLKINPTAIRTRGKGAVRAREGETYRPRLGIYLLKFDIDNKMTQTQRAKFDDIKPQYCLDCIMFCMGMMYKLEWKAATEDGAEEKSGAAAGTAARPATAPAQQPHQQQQQEEARPTLPPSTQQQQQQQQQPMQRAPDMLGANNVKLPVEIAAEGFQVDMEGNYKNFPSDRDSDSQTTDDEQYICDAKAAVKNQINGVGAAISAVAPGNRFKEGHVYCMKDLTRPQYRKIGLHGGQNKKDLCDQFKLRHYPGGVELLLWYRFDNVSKAEKNLLEYKSLLEYRMPVPPDHKQKPEWFKFPDDWSQIKINDFLKRCFDKVHTDHNFEIQPINFT